MSGVLSNFEGKIRGAIDAIFRFKEDGKKIFFVTNETQYDDADLVKNLEKLCINGVSQVNILKVVLVKVN